MYALGVFVIGRRTLVDYTTFPFQRETRGKPAVRSRDAFGQTISNNNYSLIMQAVVFRDVMLNQNSFCGISPFIVVGPGLLLAFTY